MRRFGWMITALLFLSAAASAEEWNKSFPISGVAELRVETSDAQIHVDTWDEKKIDAHITSTKWGFGQGGIEVKDHQSGDSVELEVRFPHGWPDRWRNPLTSSHQTSPVVSPASGEAGAERSGWRRNSAAAVAVGVEALAAEPAAQELGQDLARAEASCCLVLDPACPSERLGGCWRKASLIPSDRPAESW